MTARDRPDILIEWTVSTENRDFRLEPVSIPAPERPYANTAPEQQSRQLHWGEHWCVGPTADRMENGRTLI